MKIVWWDENVHWPKFLVAAIIIGIAVSFPIFLFERFLEIKLSGYLIGGMALVSAFHWPLDCPVDSNESHFSRSAGWF